MNETDSDDRKPGSKAAEAAERDKQSDTKSKKGEEGELEEGLDESFPGSDTPASTTREGKK